MKSLSEAAEIVQQFQHGALTSRLSDIETRVRGTSRIGCLEALVDFNIAPILLEAALTIKQAASQVNVLIHAAGVLLALPAILEEGEIVESLSLGAGNTGRSFDLETDRRVAEFTFIDWKGGPESIRQNALFEDFYRLAEAENEKTRCLYVKGLTYPLKFLNGKRDVSSVMSRNRRLWADFQSRYGDRFRTINEYYGHRRNRVQVLDLLKVVPSILEG